jgi:hypothetical protein
LVAEGRVGFGDDVVLLAEFVVCGAARNSTTSVSASRADTHRCLSAESRTVA